MTAPTTPDLQTGERFEFGENWRRFLARLNGERIRLAEESLKDMLEVDDLAGRRFLDVGSGSGLFSLAARRLGARVHSFDDDPQSVACALELRRRYFPADPAWTVERGSVLDGDYLAGLGQFDVVYAWGVLHHTGQMWEALANVDGLVEPGGRLFLAIYNDRGWWSHFWRRIKRTYNALPRPLRLPFALLVLVPREVKSALFSLVTLRPMRYVRSFTEYSARQRGMSRWHDLLDWVGGYPYEFARPEAIFDFYRARGYILRRLRTNVGLGCNEFVFEKADVIPHHRAHSAYMPRDHREE